MFWITCLNRVKNKIHIDFHPLFFLLDREFRQALQSGRLWLPGLPLAVLQAGAEVISQTDAQRLPRPPKSQHRDGTFHRPRRLQVHARQQSHRSVALFRQTTLLWELQSERVTQRDLLWACKQSWSASNQQLLNYGGDSFCFGPLKATTQHHFPESDSEFTGLPAKIHVCNVIKIVVWCGVVS